MSKDAFSQLLNLGEIVVHLDLILSKLCDIEKNQMTYDEEDRKHDEQYREDLVTWRKAMADAKEARDWDSFHTLPTPGTERNS